MIAQQFDGLGDRTRPGVWCLIRRGYLGLQVQEDSSLRLETTTFWVTEQRRRCRRPEPGEIGAKRVLGPGDTAHATPGTTSHLPTHQLTIHLGLGSCALSRSPQQRWLLDGLWSRQAALSDVFDPVPNLKCCFTGFRTAYISLPDALVRFQYSAAILHHSSPHVTSGNVAWLNVVKTILLV